MCGFALLARLLEEACCQAGGFAEKAGGSKRSRDPSTNAVVLQKKPLLLWNGRYELHRRLVHILDDQVWGVSQLLAALPVGQAGQLIPGEVFMHNHVHGPGIVRARHLEL